MLLSGELSTVQASATKEAVCAASPDSEAHIEWFSKNPIKLTYPSPKIEEIKELQEIANGIFKLLEKLPQREQIPKNAGSSQIHWDRLKRCDQKILEIWGTTLENGWIKYQNLEAEPKSSGGFFCCCCEDDFSEEAINRSLDVLTSRLFALDTQVSVKIVEEQTREDLAFMCWQAHHIKFLVKRSFQGPGDFDKPCCFLQREAGLAKRVILRPADLRDSEFSGYEEKVRYKLFVYCNYLMADLKKRMESLVRRP